MQEQEAVWPICACCGSRAQVRRRRRDEASSQEGMQWASLAAPRRRGQPEREKPRQRSLQIRQMQMQETQEQGPQIVQGDSQSLQARQVEQQQQQAPQIHRLRVV